jgi:hypothetical protein
LWPGDDLRAQIKKFGARLFHTVELDAEIEAVRECRRARLGEWIPLSLISFTDLARDGGFIVGWWHCEHAIPDECRASTMAYGNDPADPILAGKVAKRLYQPILNAVGIENEATPIIAAFVAAFAPLKKLTRGCPQTEFGQSLADIEHNQIPAHSYTLPIELL